MKIKSKAETVCELVYLLCGNSFGVLLDVYGDDGDVLTYDSEPSEYPCHACIDPDTNTILGYTAATR